MLHLLCHGGGIGIEMITQLIIAVLVATIDASTAGQKEFLINVDVDCHFEERTVCMDA